MQKNAQQVEDEQKIALNHAIRIEHNAQQLAQSFQNDATTAGSNAKNLQKLAIQHRQSLQQGQIEANLTNILNQMMKIYDVLVQNYIDYRHTPIKEIRESLLFLQNHYQK